MGNSSSKLEKALAECPDDERYFGLENFGNTCYANSVLQALYFCRPFREKLAAYAASQPRDAGAGGAAGETLLTCLADLFHQIVAAKKRTGVISPKRFVQRLKRDNEAFRSYMHQDAHEFLNYLLNATSELLEAEAKAQRANATTQQPPPQSPQQQQQQHDPSHQQQQQAAAPPSGTWVTDIFQGRLVNETRCLQCETVTSREEAFMDLGLEVENNTSLTACLKQFSSTEMLACDDKFFCDACGCLQEAQKRLKIRELPRCLILHLKRFKYMRHLNRERKLPYRVAFPFDLKLPNTTAHGPAGADAAYRLFAVVVHVGSNMHHGHYVALIKSRSQWLFFDDDAVEPIREEQVAATFGATQEGAPHMDHGYLLFYERDGGASAAAADGGGSGGVADAAAAGAAAAAPCGDNGGGGLGGLAVGAGANGVAAAR